MTKYHFINIEYKTELDEAIIYLWGRNVNTLEKKLFKIHGFKPRFYVPEDDPIPQSSAILQVNNGFKSIFGESFKQIITQIPSDIPKLREYFSKTCQADIPFTRTFLIEMNILTQFEAPDKEDVHYNEIIGG